VVRRGNSGAARAEVGEEGPGEDPGRAAELLRWFAGVRARRCGVAGVEQSFCAGGTMGEAMAMVMRRCAMDLGSEGEAN
jgi:hypothetical protein